MTSEVLIMTPNAIAMAADSVVTINNKKTYDGVNKLFMLSNNPPMGIMIYNNSNFFNIPLETIIKDFRKKHKNSNLKCIAEFKESFKEYLENICNKEDQIKFISMDLKFKNFIKQVKVKLKKNSQHIETYVNEITNVDNEKFEKELFKDNNFKKYYINQIKSVVVELNIENVDLETVLRKLFIKKVIYDKLIGVVIAGFHEDSLLPTALSFKIIQLNDNKFIFDDFESYMLSNAPAIIKPFAQTNTIKSFLDGIDISIYFHLSKFIARIVRDYSNNLKLLVETNGRLACKEDYKIKEELDEIEFQSEQIVNDYIIFADDFIKENNQNTLKFVQALPKTELSNLAESLIKITSLKVKVKNNIENVGGDVDVAIITKGDGFIWTKRKHYFDKVLNPQFFNRKNI